jgi:phosphate transport system substrate-binding protein
LIVVAALVVMDLRARQRGDEILQANAAKLESTTVSPSPAAGSDASQQRPAVEPDRVAESADGPVGEWRPQVDTPPSVDNGQHDGAEPQPYQPREQEVSPTPVALSQVAEPAPLEGPAPDRGDPAAEPNPDPAAEAAAQPDNRSDNPPAAPTPDNSDRSPRNEQAQINGAGATFPYPLYQKWFSEFHHQHPQLQINYQSIGSGGGISQLQLRTVDFAASDAPMTDQQLRDTTFRVLHIPTVLGAVVFVYNIPGVEGTVNFTPEALTGIFMGKIVTWKDPAITSANPRLVFPDQQIAVIHRSDPSAATFIVTDYFAKVSDDWRESLGSGASVRWPSGLGGKGNEGVVGIVKQTEGSIGYVDLIYAAGTRLRAGAVRNSRGQFVKATLDSLTAAAASVPVFDDLRESITNAPGLDAYPIASYTWLLVPQQWRDSAKRKGLKDFLFWMVNEGQRAAPAMSYAPLPGNVAEQVRQRISLIR